MRLTSRQKLALKIKERYKIRRSVFTLAVPVVIALLFAYLAFQSGYAKTSVIGTGLFPSKPATSNALNLKEEEFEILSGNLSISSAIVTHSNPNIAKNQLDFVIVAIPVIAFGPYAYDVTREDRKTRKYQEDFAALLFELAELVRGGIDPTKAFLTLSEKNTGSITKFVQTTAKQMQVGYSFENALRNLGALINTDLVKKYVDLVIQASYSGGSVAGLIQKASQDLQTFITIDKEKRAGLSQYTIILYAGQVILIVTCAILVILFLPDLNSISSIGSAGISGLLGNADIQSVTVERDLFYLIIINGFLGGLVIGKISEGKLKFGLKHSLILIVIGLIAWTGFVTPFVSTSAQYHITVVSTSTEGTIGYPMLSPLVVRLTNTKGAPVNDTDVFFSISPSGSINPKLALTDSNGTAQTSIVLGDTPGIYTITVTCGASQIVVPILAVGSNSS